MQTNKKSFLTMKKTAAIIAAVCTTLPFSAAHAIHYNGPLVVDANYIKKHGGVI